jgi:SAM-dependent methyltransferase
MSYRCPNCREPLDAHELVCANGHRYATLDGVLSLVSDDFARQLGPFSAALLQYRGRLSPRLLDPAAYEALPYGPTVDGDREWQQRQYDIEVLRHLLAGREHQRVLDVGAYNGWLSHCLAEWGHTLTGVDPFADPNYGLGARRFYRAHWRAVQMDLRDLSLLDECYDVVILNRCLAFFPDPAAYLRHAQKRVASGGMLVALGLQIFFDSRAKAKQVQTRALAYREQFGQPFFLWPTRGYLDAADSAGLMAAGLGLRPYRQMWLPDLRARLDPRRPRHYYGLWCSP